jgi:hypothetical protein
VAPSGLLGLGSPLIGEMPPSSGVASVIGPSVLPASAPNPMIARDGAAIRFALGYDTDPLNATAIGQVRVLTARLPALGRAAGLRGVRYEVGGRADLGGGPAAPGPELGHGLS